MLQVRNKPQITCPIHYLLRIVLRDDRCHARDAIRMCTAANPELFVLSYSHTALGWSGAGIHERAWDEARLRYLRSVAQRMLTNCFTSRARGRNKRCLLTCTKVLRALPSREIPHPTFHMIAHGYAVTSAQAVQPTGIVGSALHFVVAQPVSYWRAGIYGENDRRVIISATAVTYKL
jgi:hypothetical protein